LILYIWAVLPITGGSSLWKAVFVVVATAIVAVSTVRKRSSLSEIGLRLDNFVPAALVYLGASIPYAGAILLYHQDSIVAWSLGSADLPAMAQVVAWAFLQEFCLLAFLLPRLHEMSGQRVLSVTLAATIFGFFHLPNPFLTLYSMGGALVGAALFLRWPNLPAAALAHATASALVGSLLPSVITGGMKVGPGYWFSG
jgi:membrane protease YdiL (CAAX protease family)